MKVVHIVPGSGGTFYCQNCLRDSLLVPALRELGLDVILVPMYLPLFTDGPPLEKDAPVFFGALNVYLQQKVPLFRRTPRWLDRLFDARWLLGLVARKAASTSAEGLEEMTLSMLSGADGAQAKELDRLLWWLKSEIKPEIVHISNALLLGLAPRMKDELGCRIVCSLQDEHDWVDAMRPSYLEKVWGAMAEKARAVDAFVPVSRYYADVMTRRLALPEEKVHVVYIGVPLEAYEYREPEFSPPTIGYLSRLSRSLGLAVLVEAFMKLKSRGGFENLRLRAMGGKTAPDERFLAGEKRRLKRRGLEGDVDFLDGFSRGERASFMHTISLLSVPVPGGEAFGMYLLEAMASGVPVVQPRAGAFDEIVEATGGGVVYEPNDADALADALAAMLSDPERAVDLGRAGRRAVEENFTIAESAERTRELYEMLVEPASRTDGEESE